MMSNLTKLRLALYLGVIALFSACSGTGGGSNQAARTSQPLQTGYPAAVVTAQQLVAEKHSIAESQVQVRDYKAQNWSNDCLDFPIVGEECLDESIPGFVGVVSVSNTQYEFRADEAGELIRLIPEAALLARQTLAQQINLSDEEIIFAGFEELEWADTCLEIIREGITCSTETTPGYLIFLLAGDSLVEYHTNLSGDLILAVNSP